jgi:hypothetical protein
MLGISVARVDPDSVVNPSGIPGRIMRQLTLWWPPIAASGYMHTRLHNLCDARQLFLADLEWAFFKQVL